MDAITYIKKPDYADGRPDAADGLTGIHAMTANTDGILDYLHEFKSEVQEGTDIFTVGEANGVAPSDLKYWTGKDGVFDMVFEFGLVNIDLPDESNWCERREWKLGDFRSFFSENLEVSDETGGWFPAFLENHDQPRSIDHFMPGEGNRIAKAKALSTLLLTMKGTPFVMQGEELGFVNVDWPSIDDYNDISTRNHYSFALEEGYTEEEAMDGVHHFARDSARTPMQWDASANAGFTKGEPWLPVYPDYQVFNRAEEKKDPDSVLNYYISLSGLRREHSELREGDYEDIMPDSDSIFAYTRTQGDKKATILINFTDSEARYDADLIKDSECLITSCGDTSPGILAPFEAVVYGQK